jgi:hypothetical protein
LEWRIITSYGDIFLQYLKNGAKTQRDANKYICSFQNGRQSGKDILVADGQLEVSIAGESSHASVADQAGRPNASFYNFLAKSTKIR